MKVVEAPDRFVAGEESAAIRHIEGGPALPRDRTVPTAISGLRGRPTLVNNVETLANIALIARFGAQWFQSVGDADDPGTMLVTLSATSTTAGALEVPTGSALAGLIENAGGTDLPMRGPRRRLSRKLGSPQPKSAMCGCRGRDSRIWEPRPARASFMRSGPPNAAWPAPRRSPAISSMRAPASAVPASTDSPASPN